MQTFKAIKMIWLSKETGKISVSKKPPTRVNSSKHMSTMRANLLMATSKALNGWSLIKTARISSLKRSFQKMR